MLLTVWVWRHSGKDVWYNNHPSALKGRSLVCKYIFSNLTSAASTAVSEHTGKWFPLWQLGFMYIHTGGRRGAPQITSRVVLLYLRENKTKKSWSCILKKSRQRWFYCQQVQGEKSKNGKGRQSCLTFLVVQTLWDRNRMSGLWVVTVLHLILLLQIKSNEKHADEELSNGGNAVRLHRGLGELSLQEVQRDRMSEHRRGNMLIVGLRWPSLLLSVNMEHLPFCCFLCCFYMLPAIVNHFGALMLQQQQQQTYVHWSVFGRERMGELIYY